MIRGCRLQSCDDLGGVAMLHALRCNMKSGFFMAVWSNSWRRDCGLCTTAMFGYGLYRQRSPKLEALERKDMHAICRVRRSAMRHCYQNFKMHPTTYYSKKNAPSCQMEPSRASSNYRTYPLLYAAAPRHHQHSWS